MAMWNPWRGCHKYSEGCRFCYIHKGDSRRGVDTNVVTKADNFCAPVERYKRGEKKGEYKIKSGETVYLCFSSDFLLPDADQWRSDCWRMMRERPDLNFLFLTKRIERFMDCIPPDWGDGYENVTVGCTVENQAEAYRRLPLFETLPIVHKNIILQPMLEAMDIERHLGDVELVVVGGESDRNARPLDYSDAVRSTVPRRKSVTAIFGGSIMIQTARQLKDLIRNLSRKNAADAQIFMRNYMMEHFLERIFLSVYRDIFILKGGMLVATVVGVEGEALLPCPAT